VTELIYRHGRFGWIQRRPDPADLAAMVWSAADVARIEAEKKAAAKRQAAAAKPDAVHATSG
jgi:hypothetical protein